jgi:adenylate cyclase
LLARLHTGEVLTGNIGSEQKMKFGCMGDPVNLASRLEGLCKVYGVGIMCSGPTQEALRKPSDFGFVTRRLDLVQVKGKKDPTEIFELIGRNCPEEAWGIEPVTPTQISQAQLYEEALDAYQKANFSEAVLLTDNLHKQIPDDVAVSRLLERAKGYMNLMDQSTQKAGFWQFLNINSEPPISAVDLAAWTGVEKMVDK